MLNFLHPNTETRKGRRLAVLYGTIAIAWIALSYTVVAVFYVYPELDGGKSISIDERVFAALFFLIFIIGFGLLAKRFWQKHSLGVASFGFIYITIDIALRFRDFSLDQALFLLPPLLLSIHGVRGAQAMRRHVAEQPVRELRKRQRSTRSAIANLQ